MQAANQLKRDAERRQRKSAALRQRPGAVAVPPAGQETEVARLTRELNEALQQQTATADVLKVISQLDLRLADSARAHWPSRPLSFARLTLVQSSSARDGGVLRLVANFGVYDEAERYWLEHPVPVGRGSASRARRMWKVRRSMLRTCWPIPNTEPRTYQELAGYAQYPGRANAARRND